MEFKEIHFWSISNLIFTACVACKIQVRNRPKMDFIELHFLKSIFQKSSADQQGVSKIGTAGNLCHSFVPAWDLVENITITFLCRNFSTMWEKHQSEWMEIIPFYKGLNREVGPNRWWS